MSYQRVIPRDLFNEGNLFKCYGKLWIELERWHMEDKLEHHNDGEQFEVLQDDDGNTFIYNVHLIVNNRVYMPYRPLNSRDPWPLLIDLPNGDTINVFEDDGELSYEFKIFIGVAK